MVADQQQIADILADRQLHDRLAMHMLRGASHHGGAVENIENRLAEFRIGRTCVITDSVHGMFLPQMRCKSSINLSATASSAMDRP
ncbi:hypothetical protein DIE18_35610 [Burkholderia sp. Bp9125]|nr:hypothetical protein DIE18_35610 [Burkholderia sp. Bp9125]